MTQFVVQEITDQLIETIIQRLSEKVGIWAQILIDRKLLRNVEDFGIVHRGSRVRITKFPAIRVIYSPNITTSEFATRVLEEQHNFYIDCMYQLITAKDKTVPEEAVTVLGRSVQSYLNSFNERQFTVTGDRKKVNYNVGDSFAPSIELGFSETGSVRIARITYWVKMYPIFILGES